VSRTALVTGGAGFIGRALVAQLAADWTVVVYDAMTYAAHPGALAVLAARLGVEVVEGDVADPVAFDRALATHTPDVVLHLAAESHVDRSLEDPGPFLHTNIRGTWNVARACLARQIRLVHVSTDEVYGDRDGAPAALEGDPCAPTNPYSVSKAAGDQLVLSLVRSHDLDAVVTRGVNTYGPGQFPEKLLPRAARCWRTGKPMGVYGDGQQVREWLYVDDHARGIAAAIGAPRGSVLHFGGASCTNRTILARWADALDVDARLASIPDRPGHDRRYALDDTATRARLAWAPRVTLHDGLARTAAWSLERPTFWDDALARADVQGFFVRRYGDGAATHDPAATLPLAPVVGD